MDNIIKKFIKDVTKEYGEPLDGDAVEHIAEVVKIKLDFQNGNVTYDEYKSNLKQLINKSGELGI